MSAAPTWDASGVTLTLDDGSARRLSVHDLMECAPSQFDPVSGQRSAPPQTLPLAARLRAVEATHDGWRLDIDPFGPFEVRRADLAPYLRPAPARPSPIAWLGPCDELEEIFDYGAFLADPDVRRACLTRVARHGLARLAGAPAVSGEIERFIAAFGHVRETNYGRIFDVRVVPRPQNLAGGGQGLEPHTDNPYRDPVPTLQALHCLVDSPAGGESRFVDGLALAQALRDCRPDDLALLSRWPVRFAWAGGETRLSAEAPVITLGPGGDFEAIRFNHRAFQAIIAPADVREAWRGAYRRLAERVNAPEAGVAFTLRPGDMVLFDNRRILHGRTAIGEAGEGARHLQGAYADIDGLRSTLAALDARETERRVAQVEDLFNSPAMSPDYGERLSIRDHMLQAADLALSRGASGTMIAACLLHDLGWGLGEGERAHEASGADLVETVFGPAVALPVRWHVEAKRYLVAVEVDYHDRLSEASRETLRRQGGPLTPPQCRAFERAPGFDQAIALRRIDDEAKCVGRAVAPFAAYRDLLRRLAAARLHDEPMTRSGNLA